MQNSWRLNFLTLFLVAAVVVADEWSYPALASNGEMTEPEQWGGECDSGMRQSPIDLAYGASVRGAFDDFVFQDYDKAIVGAQVTNNGHSIQINVGAPENVVMRGGGLPQKYVLDQMHFHWGSEHTINGRRYPLELHMVHHDSRFASLNDALASKNGVAVLGILFHVSMKANENLENILNAVHQVADLSGKSATIQKSLRADALLPSNSSTFFRYEGSLTTPGCTESVIWTVFTQTISISFEQAEMFKLVKDSHGEELTHNFRSLKPLNSRSLVYVAPMVDLVGYPGAGSLNKPCLAVLVATVVLLPILKWFH